MNGAKAPETPSPVLQEKTVTPETLPTVIGADEGYDGLSQVTVNPDSQLKAENIRSGKTIFGVTGAFVGEEIYTDAIDMDLFCPFKTKLLSTYADNFFELNVGTQVFYPVECVQTTKPENAVEIKYDQDVVETEYHGFYMMAEKSGHSTGTYITSGGVNWYNVKGVLPAGNHTMLAAGGQKYTHVKGDFIVYPKVKGNTTFSGRYVPTDADWPECVVHVDTDITKDSLNNAGFIITIPEDLVYNYIAYSWSTMQATSITITVLPLKVVYT